jgi:hypothetical protein
MYANFHKHQVIAWEYIQNETMIRDENRYLFKYQFFVFSLIVNKYDTESAMQNDILVFNIELLKKYVKNIKFIIYLLKW